MHREELFSKFSDMLSKMNTREEKLAAAAKAFEQIFSVKPFEVAILGYDAGWELLSFIWPYELKKAGVIPINSPKSLVASTARMRRGSIDNNFVATPHLRIFEYVRQQGDDLTPIQKIMSVPMLDNEKLVGVIQINRRGNFLEDSGHDFTDKQREVLSVLANILAAHIST